MKPKKQTKKEQAVESAAPLEVLIPEELTEELNTVQQKTFSLKGKHSEEELVDVDNQKQLMRGITGLMLQKFYRAVKNNELDFDQEIKLFKELGKFIGYETDGNKIAQDIGMDAFAMRYLEINTNITRVSKSASK